MKVYMNRMQREVLSIGARDNVVVAGRGTGKGMVQAAVLLNALQQMPRCTVGIVTPSAVRALTNTLPSMTVHWERWGYKRDVHWCIGHRPPRALGWDRPLYEPYSWDNMIGFYNGAVCQIVSQDRKGTSNSKSFDFLAIDEGKFVKFEQLKDETFLANRGQQVEFGHCPLHHGMLVTSDMPTTKAGSWFMNYEGEMDRELIEVIVGLKRERELIVARLRAGDAPGYLEGRLRMVERQLAGLRKHALYYGVYSSLTNLEVLGEGYIRQMKRDLPPLVFLTSVLCLPVRQLRDGFYSSMKERHLYTAADFNYLDNLEYDFGRAKVGARSMEVDADLMGDAPLCIAFDFNRNINWLVVGQADEARGRMNTVKAFWVKYERKLVELCRDFSQYYRLRKNREVVFYYDSTALGSNYAVNDRDFRRVIEETLRADGWVVKSVYVGNPMNHGEKHLLINQGFQGQGRLTPYLNQDNCEDLLVSLQTAGVYNGKKDKRGEKLAETEEDRLETRTDGSDAWDTLYIGCEKFPQRGGGWFLRSSNWD